MDTQAIVRAINNIDWDLGAMVLILNAVSVLIIIALFRIAKALEQRNKSDKEQPCKEGASK